MFKKFFSVSLGFLLIHSQFLSYLNAQSPSLTAEAVRVVPRQISEKDAAQTEKVKKQSARYKVGKKVILRLRESNHQIKGTITLLDENGVTIAEKESGQSFSAAYTQLTSIKDDGSVIKAIVVGAVVATIVVVTVLVSQYCANEGGC